MIERDELASGDKISTGDLIQYEAGMVFKITDIHSDGFITVERVVSLRDQNSECWARASDDAPTPGARVYMADRQHPLMLRESVMWALPAMRGSDESFGVVISATGQDRWYLILANEGGLEHIHKYEATHDMSPTDVEDARKIEAIHPPALMDEISRMLTGRPKKTSKPGKTWRIWKIK